MLELSTTIKGISTAPKSRAGLTAKKATRKARAHLRYIARPSAVDAEMWHGLKDVCGSRISPAKGNRTAARAALRIAFDKRAGQGGKTGCRVAEKLMFSLPNDFPSKARKEALARVMIILVGDSEAAAYGTLHRDKPGNQHAHIMLVDGYESAREARARKPGAQRVRRRQKLRFGDLGRPKEVRAIIAQEINAVAEKYSVKGVEHRSFKNRGIERPASRHRGPVQNARQNKPEAALKATKRADELKVKIRRQAAIPASEIRTTMPVRQTAKKILQPDLEI
ncbi:MobA/MobL family protein [Puniceibacterium sediminis]|uniref:MobA/MobL family protein n=1 Tax=Puniceibacterium sediminis TaxID=1608407 RepID=A0A238ZXN8_9RHOB|nr:MobA/MobL family protein [Puniceibacterium sediminis]SNR88135.1 MobA/MobL family protein [Puniceibacterium sediminis]